MLWILHLAAGGYDRHLRALRRTYAAQLAALRAAVARWFPEGTRVTPPDGGYVLWVELPAGVDGVAVPEAALKERISVAPGALFTTSDRYRSCARLSGALWSDRVRDAVRTVGGIACALGRPR